MASREYLEALLSKVKAFLPDVLMQQLHAAALPSSGGTASWRSPTLTVFDRMALEQLRPEALKAASDEDVQESWDRLGKWHGQAMRRKMDPSAYTRAGGYVLAELKRRGIKYDPESALAKESHKKSSLQTRLEDLPVIVPLARGLVSILKREGGAELVMGELPADSVDMELAKALAGVGLAQDASDATEVIDLTPAGGVSVFDLLLVLSGDMLPGPDPLEKAEWSGAFMNDLPDSAFLYVEPGGEKDGEGKTKPRSLRHFPVRDAEGELDLPHLRNALARIPQSNVSAAAKEAARRKATKLLDEAHEKSLAEQVAGEGLELVLKSSDNPRVLFKSEEKQIQYLVVGDPDVIDTWGHKISREEIAKACHCYTGVREVHFEHGKDITGKAAVIENYTCPVSIKKGEPFLDGKAPEDITWGSWIMGLHIADKKIWKAVEQYGASWAGNARKVNR